METGFFEADVVTSPPRGADMPHTAAWDALRAVTWWRARRVGLT